jgi:hypothetical protein
MTEKQFFNIFASNSWMMVPKKLLAEIGAIETILLCYMIDKAKYHKTLTIHFDNEEKAAKLIGLGSRKTFNKYTGILHDHNLVHRELKGVPAKYYYTLNVDAILEAFDKEHLDVTDRNTQMCPIVTSECNETEHLSNNTTNNKTTNNTTSAKADKVFINFIGEEFIPNYPKVVPVKRIWTQVTELTKELNTYSVEQYEELCGKIRKHLVAYVKSTEKKYLLAPDNYIAARKWEEDLSVTSAKSSKNGAMNDKVNDDYLNLLKKHGL